MDSESINLRSNRGPGAMKKIGEEILYEEVLRALNKDKVNYAVCGGFAVILYGYNRLTIDLDLVVGLDKENLGKVYDVLKSLNYKTEVPIKKEEFVQEEKLKQLDREKNMKVVSFHNLKDPMRVIDIGVNLPYVSEILKKKKHIKIKDISVPIISIKDLIKIKEELARPRDKIDVENLKKIKKIN